MSAGHKDIRRLSFQARYLPYGPAKTALLEEAVALAEALGDSQQAFHMRQELIESATFSGYPEKALAAFAWCSAFADRNEQLGLGAQLTWPLKWIMDSLSAFPHISRATILEMFADMERRYQQHGFNRRAICCLRWRTARNMGDIDDVPRLYDEWEGLPRDSSSDCLACEQNHRVRYQIFRGDDQRAVQAAQPILSGGMRCAEIPHATLGRLLLPLVRLGRGEEGVTLHRRGYRLICHNPKFIDIAAEHLKFLTVTGNLAPAVRLLEQHLAWSLTTFDLIERFNFSIAAQFLCAQMAAGGKREIKLAAPATFPALRENGRYPPAELGAWFAADAAGLAAKFDARNGNSYFQDQLAESSTWTALVQKVPLRKPRAKAEDATIERPDDEE